MQIILLHAPPWKLPAPGEDTSTHQDQPPPNFSGPPHKSVDYLRMPTGLLSLAAQAQSAGHTVYLFNLANFSWRHVDALIKRARADLYGMTCYTSNRRGVAALAELIHQYHPHAHV
ncbi:MAG: cobalamin B12-binding domain-containing protein, partial [Desulfarculaceae bacterium]